MADTKKWRDRVTSDSNEKIFAPKSWDFTFHSYPEELKGSPELSHYVMFYISVPELRGDGVAVEQPASNEPTKSIRDYLQGKGTDKFGDQSAQFANFSRRQGLEWEGKAEEQLGQAIVAEVMSTRKGTPEEQVKEEIKSMGHRGAAGAYRNMAYLATAVGKTRMVMAKEAICLYIPENISTAYDLDWEASSFRTMSTMGQAVASAVGGSEGLTFSKALGALGTAGTQLGLNMAFGDILSVGAKQVQNPYIEMLFRGIKNRQFEMSFKFTPKSEKEAKNVHNIIQTFKRYALPKVTGEGDIAKTYFTYPAEWDVIFYTVVNDDPIRNKFISRYGRSVITNIKVDYSAAGTSSFLQPNEMGAAPVETDLSLSFSEIDLITADMVENESLGF